jgi:hypothetical protein
MKFNANIIGKTVEIAAGVVIDDGSEDGFTTTTKIRGEVRDLKVTEDGAQVVYVRLGGVVCGRMIDPDELHPFGVEDGDGGQVVELVD